MAETKSLIKKLVTVMAGVKRVAKNGTNTFQNYDYVTEADILAAVRDGLAAANVFIFSSVENAQHDKEANMTTVIMKHTFVDGDTGEEFVVKSMGQGSDKQDKGSNKAITGAMKYFLMKNFMMPTGDDPEATDEAGKSTGPKLTKATVTSVTTGTPASGGGTKSTYGFSNRAKTTATAVKTAEPEMNTDDSF